ncbi:MAG: acyl-CoA dehydrogenase family protein [Clostridia bacterium]|jgi:alkylation response protein AidB-like acyl-CoA dehydrogenase|nr:acyl-CoA dehydrogenase family protein [Clostridia bacterium]
MSYFVLTQEHEAIRDKAREFVQKEVLPKAKELDDGRKFPWDLVKRCIELGFLGLPVPQEYGGSGAGALSLALVIEEIAKAQGSLALILDTHNSLGCMALLFAGTEEQKQKYLVPAARGEKLLAFSLTEPQAGSDAGATKTTAVLEGEEWVINGHKRWVNNFGVAGTYVITALTDPAKGNKGISAFIMDKETPGLRTGARERTLGLNNTCVGEVFLENCRIPRANLLGPLNKGLSLFLKAVDEGRLAVAAISVGMAQGALDRSIAYAKERIQFGQPIIRNQAIAFYLAEMATKIEVSRTMLYRVAAMRDAGLEFSREVAMLKLFASEMCQWVCDRAVQIHGGNGYSKEYEVERFLRDARMLTLGEGTSEINKMIISGKLSG